jgi:hypothetical protein
MLECKSGCGGRERGRSMERERGEVRRGKTERERERAWGLFGLIKYI